MAVAHVAARSWASFAGSSLALTRQPGVRHPTSTSARTPVVTEMTPSSTARPPPGGLSRSFACNSPDTVSHHTSTSLELQRLQKLLKVHPIELHAKLLRVCATNAHVDPLLCACAPCHRVDARAHRQTESSSLADSSLSHRLTSTARDGGCVVDDEAGAPRG